MNSKWEPNTHDEDFQTELRTKKQALMKVKADNLNKRLLETHTRRKLQPFKTNKMLSKELDA